MKDINYLTLLLFPTLFALVVWFVKRIIADFDKKHENFSIEMKSLRTTVKNDLQSTIDSFNQYKSEVDNQKQHLLEYSYNNKSEVLELTNKLKNSSLDFKVISESFHVKLKSLDFTLTKVIRTTKENETNLEGLHGKILTFKKSSDNNLKLTQDNRKLLKRHNSVIVELKNKVEKK